jgi:hypothetical protein
MQIKEALNKVLSLFESGDIPQAIVYATFPPADVPCSRWSFLNRVLVALSGTYDARGYKQWQESKRFVRKGSRAIHIFVPRFRTVKDEETNTEEKMLSGFMGAPVFRVEDTAGEPLAYQNIQLPELPLMDVARAWGIKVSGIPENGRYYGCYHSSRQQITLATPEEAVFFHKLAHAGHDRIGELKKTPTWEKEIVAEFSAAALSLMVGRKMVMGNHAEYIQHYAEKGGITLMTACLRLVDSVEKVLREILQEK